MRCLRGDDDVITNKGLVKLKNIKNGDLVLTHDGSFQKVINKENNGIRKVDRITTNLNINYSTNNHRWLVLNNLSGEFREVYASDLKEGDVLLLNNRSVSGEYQDFPKYTDLKLPKLDEDLAWFIGYFLGNGNVSTRTRSDTGFEDNKFRVCIPTNYPTIVNKVKSIFEKIVGTYSIHKKKSAIELTSSKKCFVEYFLNIKQPNTPIQIPDFIKQNTSSIQLAFLAGVLDSDGSVRNDNKNGKGYGQITLNSSKYSIFITQLQALYNLNGIITKTQTKIRKEKSNEYILKTVSFKYRKECVEKLSLYSEKLKEDYILEEISKEKDGIYFPKYLAIRGEGNKIWNSCKRCSLNKVLEYYPDLNYVPAVITNIEKDVEEVEVFDIEVENNHNFYINGVLTHNSALAILFSPNDEEMYNSKVGNWFYDNPQRGRYNASVALERSDDNKEVFNKIFESTKEYGEPGFFFRSDSGIGCNPCFEIGFKPVLEIQKPDGISKQTGIQFCNLVSISGKESTTEEKFYKQCKAAATIGTIQATYNSFPFLGEVTEQLAKNDPLIGVSISGIMMNPDILLNENILRKGAEIIKEQNSKIANLLRINPASRTTCIKPDGNISTLTGNTPGCHGQHAKRYIRRVQVNKEEEAGKVYAKYNPKAVVESVWSNNHTDNCIMFAIESDDNVKTKSELLGIRQLEVVKLLYNNWILPGMVDPTNPVCNNVSNTVTVPNHDWYKVRDWVWNNKNFIAGVSFIPSTGDLNFTQPPYSEVFISEELVEMYGDGVIFASGLIVDAEKTFGNLWKACDTFNYKGEKLYSTVEDAKEFIKELNVTEDPSYLNKPHSEWVKANSIQYNNWVKVLSTLGYTEEFIDEILDSDIEIPIAEIQKYLDKTAFTNVKNLNAKRDIMRRMKKFGDTYFGEDYNTMIEALKYVQLYHDWCDITRNYTPIDWTTVKWKKVLIDADTTGAQACSGGQCDITKI